MTGGWFKAGRRSHFAEAPGDRSLCMTHVAPISLAGTPEVRECSRCVELQIAAEVEAERIARTPAGPPRPVEYRPLTDAEKADAAALGHGMKHRSRIDRERTRWA